MDVGKTFELWAGPTVKYIAHHRDGLRLTIQYYGVRAPDEMFKVRGTMKNGLHSSQHRLIRVLADNAKSYVHIRSGRYAQDIEHLLKGKTLP